MQDSNIVFKVTTVGVEEATAKMNSLGATITKLTYNANGSVTAQGKLSNTLNQQAGAADKSAAATSRASKAHESYAYHIAKTTIQSALVNKAFLGLVDAAGQAVKQVDLLQNFPASMAALGLSSKDASAAILKLRDYIAGVGGDLTTATTSVARFAEVTKNVKAATAEFVGVNNALIAGGAGAEVQANALEQLIQSYSRGKPQLIEWRSLMVAMPAQLSQVAQAMKLPNAQALGEALTKGKVSMQDFITQLTKLSTGTGPIAQQALARMQGIQFAANVLKNALTNGLAAIYQAVGRQNIVAVFSLMTQVIQVLASWAVVLINTLISLWNWVSKIFGGPQIAHFSGEAAGAANSLGSGASNAGDLADNLGDAGKNAKDLNKQLNKSLAAFDKMNVLPDKTSPNSGGGAGSGAGGGGGGGGLDPATASALGDIFDKIGGKLAEAGKWAKILAGILTGLAANQFIKKLFGVNPLKSLITGIKDAIKGFLKLGKTVDENGNKINRSLGEKIGGGVRTGISKASSAISSALGAIAGNIISGLGKVFAPVGSAILDFFTLTLIPRIAALGGAILDAFLVFAGGIAGALGVSLGVAIAIIAAAVVVIIGIIFLIWKNWDTIWGWIVTAYQTTWNFIVGLWQKLYDIFAGPVKWLWQFWSSVFILIVAIVATALELIFKLWVGAFKLIFALLATVAGWIYDNVIYPVYNFFVKLWQDIVNAIQAAWNFIFNNILKPVGTWINNNVIQPVFGFFKGLWDKVAGLVSGFIINVKNFLSPLTTWIKVNIIDKIANFFSGLWNGIKNGLSNMINGLRNIFSGIGNIFKTPINGIIDLINRVLQSLNRNVKVPDWVPGLGGKGVNFPLIPRLALGGVITQPTTALIGEHGSEAVIPLENNTGWIDMLASKINKAGTSQPIQLVVQIGEDQVASKIIDLINEKSQMSGRNTILI